MVKGIHQLDEGGEEFEPDLGQSSGEGLNRLSGTTLRAKG
jgi:hypothetical protein